MRFDSIVDAYRPDDGDVAYRLFRQGDEQDGECGVCAADIESVQFVTDTIDDTGDRMFVRQVAVGAWVTLTPCGHRLYLRRDQSVVEVADFSAAVT